MEASFGEERVGEEETGHPGQARGEPVQDGGFRPAMVGQLVVGLEPVAEFVAHAGGQEGRGGPVRSLTAAGRSRAWNMMLLWLALPVQMNWSFL